MKLRAECKELAELIEEGRKKVGSIRAMRYAYNKLEGTDNLDKSPEYCS